MKKILASLVCLGLTLSLVACGGAPAGQGEKAGAADKKGGAMSATQKIIKEAQGMTMEQLAKKAIEESNGKKFYGLGNSSRGKPHCHFSLNIFKQLILSTPWNLNGNNRRITRFSIS